GILPLWKPKGMTSHDCVFKIRKLLKLKKVGHTGTLDPDVTGVLPICLGKATKIAEYISNAGKEYIGEIVIGFSTITEDASGALLEKKPVSEVIQREKIEAVLQSFIGEITQTPPLYSAVKVKGKRLYEYAREGIEVERPTRKVQIYDLQLIEKASALKDGTFSFKIRVHCSKGTYIRTLAVMIGEKLGYPAHLAQLERISSGPFKKEESVTFAQIEEHLSKNTLRHIILPLEIGLSHLPKHSIDDKLTKKVKNGAVLTLPDWWPVKESEVVLYHQQKAIAIYAKHPIKKHYIKPVK